MNLNERIAAWPLLAMSFSLLTVFNHMVYGIVKNISAIHSTDKTCYEKNKHGIKSNIGLQRRFIEYVGAFISEAEVENASLPSPFAFPFQSGFIFL